MNKKIIGLLTVSCMLIGLTVFMQTRSVEARTPVAPPSDGQFNCFDLFKFGSVSVNLSSATLSPAAGSNFNVTAHIVNQNAYPVVDGAVYVKVLRLQSSAANRAANGDNVVDQMYVIRDINLGANASLDKTISWKVPSSAVSGKYQMVSYFLVGDKANITGLPFTEDVHAAPIDFTISGQDTGVILDKNSVTLNGSAYRFIGISKPINASKPAVIQATVINTTNASVNVPVVARIYRWAQTEVDGHRSDLTQQVSLKAGEKKTVTFTVKDQESLTMVVIEADYKDSKSILDVKFGREGLSYPRINNAALSSYPLKAGVPATMFVCAHAAGVTAMDGASSDKKDFGLSLPGSKVVLTLSDASGNILDSYTYTGAITSSLMGFKNSFTPKVSTGDLVLRAEAYQGTIKLDSVVTHYSCSALGSACTGSSGGSSVSNKIANSSIAWTILILLILLIVISFVAKHAKNKLKVLVFALAGLGSVAILGLAPGAVHAETVTWSLDAGTLAGGSTMYQKNWMTNVSNTNCSVPHVGACMGITLSGAHVDVTYGATVTRGGSPIANGSSLQPLDIITFQQNAYGPTDINWFIQGGGYGTPPGYWNSGPSCALQDFLYNASGIGDFYTPLHVAQPTASIVVAGPVTGSGWGPYTVTGAGTVTATVSFSATVGDMYAVANGTNSNGGCASHEAMWNFAVPQQDIPFSFPVVIPNAAPSAPVISGPTPVNVGETNTYSVVATDPDGNNIYYNIDYDSDHSSVSQVLGTVASGASESFTKSFSPAGTYTIYAQAVDTSGAASGWSSYSVTVNPSYTLTVQVLGGGTGTVTSSPAGISCTSGTCSATFVLGTSVTLTGTPNANMDFTSWGNDCSASVPPATCTVTMSADHSATATFDPTVIPQKVLGVTVVGNGSVTSSPVGISCPSGSCSQNYDVGTSVTLTATPSGSDTFTGWSGACAGVGTCTTVLSTDKAVTANFTYTLAATVTGPAGSGSVAGGGISCAAGNVGTCSVGQTVGNTITLVPTTNSGYTFNGWSGAGCSGTGNCVVSMSSAQTVTAVFATVVTQCTNGLDDDGDGLIDALDPGCSVVVPPIGEPGGGPLTSALCSPSTPTVTTVTPAAPGGSVLYSASAVTKGVGSGIFEYKWDGGGWISSATYSKSYASPGTFAGPTLQVRDARGPGAARVSDNVCGQALVPGTLVVSVGPNAASATSNQISVAQGKSFVVKWTRDLPTAPAAYSCTASITPSVADPSWTAWTGADFSANGNTGTLSTTATTPIGLYNFNLVCADASASPGPTYSSTGKVRVTLTNLNEQ